MEHPVEHLPAFMGDTAVGLGETHDNPGARNALVNWILDDAVTDIVLELGGFEGAELHTAEFQQAIGMIDTHWGNPISFTFLVQLALDRGINVHCWDPAYHGANAVQHRNQDVAARFRQHFSPDNPPHAAQAARHTVVLFGAEHFGDQGQSLNNLLPGLQWANLGAWEHP